MYTGYVINLRIYANVLNIKLLVFICVVILLYQKQKYGKGVLRGFLRHGFHAINVSFPSHPYKNGPADLNIRCPVFSTSGTTKRKEIIENGSGQGEAQKRYTKPKPQNL